MFDDTIEFRSLEDPSLSPCDDRLPLYLNDRCIEAKAHRLQL